MAANIPRMQGDLFRNILLRMAVHEFKVCRKRAQRLPKYVLMFKTNNKLRDQDISVRNKIANESATNS